MRRIPREFIVLYVFALLVERVLSQEDSGNLEMKIMGLLDRLFKSKSTEEQPKTMKEAHSAFDNTYSNEKKEQALRCWNLLALNELLAIINLKLVDKFFEFIRQDFPHKGEAHDLMQQEISSMVLLIKTSEQAGMISKSLRGYCKKEITDLVNKRWDHLSMLEFMHIKSVADAKMVIEKSPSTGESRERALFWWLNKCRYYDEIKDYNVFVKQLNNEEGVPRDLLSVMDRKTKKTLYVLAATVKTDRARILDYYLFAPKGTAVHQLLFENLLMANKTVEEADQAYELARELGDERYITLAMDSIRKLNSK